MINGLTVMRTAQPAPSQFKLNEMLDEFCLLGVAHLVCAGRYLCEPIEVYKYTRLHRQGWRAVAELTYKAEIYEIRCQMICGLKGLMICCDLSIADGDVLERGYWLVLVGLAGSVSFWPWLGTEGQSLSPLCLANSDVIWNGFITDGSYSSGLLCPIRTA